MLSKMFTVFKTKILLGAIAAALLVSGATAALAATHTGQNPGLTTAHGHPSVTATAQHKPDKDNDGDTDGDKDSEGHGQSCPGQEGDLQELLQRFHLSVEKNSAAVTAVCALHAGTFKGTTTKGAPVTSKHAYGFGEIRQILFLAQFLATKDGVKLSDANVNTYLASALQTCASSSSTMDCLKNTIPNFKPDNNGEKGGE